MSRMPGNDGRRKCLAAHINSVIVANEIVCLCRTYRFPYMQLNQTIAFSKLKVNQYRNYEDSAWRHTSFRQQIPHLGRLAMHTALP